jgi:hypothetical protein
MGEPHQHIQFGAGTFAPVASLGARIRLDDKWLVMGYTRGQLFVARNTEGYQPGNRYSVGVSSQRDFGVAAVSASLNLASERPERWGGVILQDGNLGRSDVLVGLGATYRINKYALGLGVKVPVYQHIVTNDDDGGQLSYPAIVDLSLARGFDLK